MRRPTMGGLGGAPTVAINGPGGSVNIDMSQLEAMGKKAEETSTAMEAMQASADATAASKAAADALGAVLGGGGAPFASADMKAWLPDNLGGVACESFEVQSGAVMGLADSTARADYDQGDQSFQLILIDMGGTGGLVSVTG